MVLEQGALSGKYDTKHPMPAGSARAEVYNPILGKLEILNSALFLVSDMSAAVNGITLKTDHGSYL